MYIGGGFSGGDDIDKINYQESSHNDSGSSYSATFRLADEAKVVTDGHFTSSEWRNASSHYQKVTTLNPDWTVANQCTIAEATVNGQTTSDGSFGHRFNEKGDYTVSAEGVRDAHGTYSEKLTSDGSSSTSVDEFLKSVFPDFYNSQKDTGQSHWKSSKKVVHERDFRQSGVARHQIQFHGYESLRLPLRYHVRLDLSDSPGTNVTTTSGTETSKSPPNWSTVKSSASLLPYRAQSLRCSLLRED